MLPSWIPELPTDTPVRGFLTVWKLFLQDSLHRMSLCAKIFCLCFHLLHFLLLSLEEIGLLFWMSGVAFLDVWCLSTVFKICFVEVSHHSKDLLRNLCGRKWSPCPICPPSWDHTLSNKLFLQHKK